MPSSSRITGNAGLFQAFFEGWLVRQQEFLDELLAAEEYMSSAPADHENNNNNNNVVRGLTARVLGHYQEYYDEKSRMASRNVFLAFSPTWFTPLERSFLWIAGFKPGLVRRLAIASVEDLTEDQIQRIERLSRETTRQEKSLDEEMAKIQESVASPAVVDLARRIGMHFGYVDGEIYEVDNQIEALKSSIENVMRDADRLRTRTAERMTEILSPLQNLKFLAAAAQLQFRIRTLGLQKEADREFNSRTDGW
ncbi:hypothetical protein ACH5RR_005203 [Cinchona calisaya]|uniref:DOG1 domain-containing protein n=1 Tax=Cinchona calisaya TaxID=153742 RepID=A0ABD3AKJ4_9GENT